jgi:RNA polymerase sigma-70 factor (ECF subfamily)
MPLLAEAFIEAAAPELRPSLNAIPNLEDELRAACAKARRNWPDIAVSDHVFMQYLAARTSTDAAGLTVLPLRLPEDLYLACACAHGSEAAIRAFQSHYERHYRSVFERMGLRDVSDDLAQLLLRRLFIRDGEREPAILGFGGRGALGKWVKVLAARVGHRHLERDKPRSKRTVQRDPEQIADAMGKSDPELDRLKESYRAEFKEAFKSAFSELPERDRNLFRLQYLDGLNLDKMAAVYNVGRATVARWRTAARRQLLEHTHQRLAGKLGASSQDVASIMRFIESQLDVSLTRLLRTDTKRTHNDSS